MAFRYIISGGVLWSYFRFCYSVIQYSWVLSFTFSICLFLENWSKNKCCCSSGHVYTHAPRLLRMTSLKLDAPLTPITPELSSLSLPPSLWNNNWRKSTDGKPNNGTAGIYSDLERFSFLQTQASVYLLQYTNTLCMYFSPSQGLTVFPLNGTLQSVVRAAAHNSKISVGFKSEVLLSSRSIIHNDGQCPNQALYRVTADVYSVWQEGEFS